MMSDLRYPIGQFKAPELLSSQFVAIAIDTISNFPQDLRDATESLDADQLATPYRDGGWTVKQLVHHCADSHMNALIRFKLALTEENPTIKPYDQAAWAQLADVEKEPIESSLGILTGVHKRWVSLLSSINIEDFNRTLYHPEMGKQVDLAYMLSLYRWHCDHHLAHITSLIERENW